MKPISQALFLIVIFFIPTAVLPQPAYWEGFAVVDYDAPLPSDKAERLHRQRVNSRYDKEDWVVLVSDRETGGVGRVDEGPPALDIPSDESTLIATGLIIDYSAHLSNDRRGVYTEFTFRILELIKDDTGGKLQSGEDVMADRAGGAVRYNNDHRVVYADSDRSLPRNRKLYLLFLKREGDSPNYRILNGYEFDDKRIVRSLERDGTPNLRR